MLSFLRYLNFFSFIILVHLKFKWVISEYVNILSELFLGHLKYCFFIPCKFGNIQSVTSVAELFHDGGRVHIETSPLICVMKELD